MVPRRLRALLSDNHFSVHGTTIEVSFLVSMLVPYLAYAASLAPVIDSCSSGKSCSKR
jgi:hypothetical protein